MGDQGLRVQGEWLRDQTMGGTGMGLQRQGTRGQDAGVYGDGDAVTGDPGTADRGAVAGAAETGDPGTDDLGPGAREGPRVGVTWPQGPPRGRQRHLIAVLDADAAVDLVEQGRAEEGELLRRQLGH